MANKSNSTKSTARNTERKLEQLKLSLQSPDAIVRSGAIKSLEETTDSTLLYNMVWSDCTVARRTIVSVAAKIADPVSIRVLEIASRDSDTEVKQDAKQAINNILSNVEHTDSIEILLLALRINLCDKALKRLEQIKDPRKVKLIAEAFNAGSDVIRKPLAEIIAGLDDPCFIEPLLSAYKENPGKVSVHLLRVLASMADSRCTDTFLNSLDAASGNINYYALSGLIKLKDDLRIRLIIISALNHRDLSTRQLAENAIENAEAFIEPFKGTYYEMFCHVLSVVGKMNYGGAKHPSRIKYPKSKEFLNLNFWEGSEHYRTGVKKAAVEALEASNCIEFLVSLLGDAYCHVDCYTIRDILVNIANPSCVKALILHLTKNRNVTNIYFMSDTLTKLNNPACIEALNQSLKSDNPNFRRCAAKTLAKIANPASIEVLILLLEGYEATKVLVGKDYEVLITAIEALGNIGGHRCVKVLIPLLQDKLYKVRLSVTKALAKIKDPRSVPALTTILQEKNKQIAKIASKALAQINIP